MLEVSAHLSRKPVCQAWEEASTASEYDVAEQDLAQVRIALAKRGRDQCWYRLGQVRV